MKTFSTGILLCSATTLIAACGMKKDLHQPCTVANGCTTGTGSDANSKPAQLPRPGATTDWLVDNWQPKVPAAQLSKLSGESVKNWVVKNPMIFIRALLTFSQDDPDDLIAVGPKHGPQMAPCIQKIMSVPAILDTKSVSAVADYGKCWILKDGGAVKDYEAGFSLWSSVPDAAEGSQIADGTSVKDLRTQAFPFVSLAHQYPQLKTAFQTNTVFSHVLSRDFQVDANTVEHAFFVFSLGRNAKESFVTEYDPDTHTVTLNGPVQLLLNGHMEKPFEGTDTDPLALKATWKFDHFKIGGAQNPDDTDPFAFANDAVLEGSYSFAINNYSFTATAQKKPCIVKITQKMASGPADAGQVDLCTSH